MDNVIRELEEAISSVPEHLREAEWQVDDGYEPDIAICFEYKYEEIPPQKCKNCDCGSPYACPDFDWGEAAGSEMETIANHIYSTEVAKFIAAAWTHMPDVISHVKQLRATASPEILNMMGEIKEKEAEIARLRHLVSTLMLHMQIPLQPALPFKDDTPSSVQKKIDLNRLEVVALAATRGRWIARKSDDVAKGMPKGSYIRPSGMFVQAVDVPDYWITPWTELNEDDNGWDDYEYIAEANPDTILALIQRLKVAEGKPVTASPKNRRKHSRR